MKAVVKKIIKSMPVFSVLIQYRQAVASVYSKNYRNHSATGLKRYKIYLSILFHNSFIVSNNPIKRNRQLLSKVNIVDDTQSPFFYSIDQSVLTLSRKSKIGNLTPDYTVLLESSISALEKNVDGFELASSALKDIKAYCLRCIDNLEKSKSIYKEIKIEHLRRMLKNKAETFHESLQRILFVNQLLWQEGHSLIGLGHLDKILYPYYKHDIDNGVFDKERALYLIKEFLITLHGSYAYKSNVLLGDTGQIIVLGGLTEEKTYLCNDLTYMFIQALMELQIPDPKILLRVHRLMPLELLQKSVRCIQTGIGCPLFANDEVIIPKLSDFGYEQNDVYNYGASACWEPFIIGKSSDANNVYSLNFMLPLQAVLFSGRNDYKTYYAFLAAYKQELYSYIQKCITKVFQISWESAPLLSLFTDYCIERKLDISNGGAKYNNYGFTTVALANVINSLLNVKKYIYELQALSLPELIDILLNNYNGREDAQKLFKNEPVRYGVDNDEVLALTNDLLGFVTKAIEENTPSKTGRKIKFGLSSPSYISAANNMPATPDGRNYNSPFVVHISNDKAVDFTSIFSFASKVDYSQNRFNGNVVDCIVSSHFIENNFDQFVLLLYNSFVLGIFEMQFNVLSSAVMLEAKKHPEQFERLIVRVWGFSAYFNDLPEDYKDMLIERALEHEYANNEYSTL
jgi:formate C-acetyltransferase